MLAFTGRLPRRRSPRTRSARSPTRRRSTRELERIRRRGWAEAYEEREPELNAIAAPVWASDGELAGIVALQGPIPRFGSAVARRRCRLLLDRAAAISAELGSQSG